MATGFTFGAKPVAPAFGQTGFGAQPSGSITFGTPVSSNPTPFGNAPQASTPFGTAPQASTAFGAAPQASTAFGAAPQASTMFGTTPQASTAFGTTPQASTAFGTTPQASTAFGTTPQASTGFGSTGFGMSSFGTPATTTQATGLTFGAPATSAPGFSFGAAPPLSVPSTGLTFGTPASSAPVVNTSFGFGTSAPSSGLTFGTPVTSTFTGFSLGAGTTASTGLTFGTPATTTTPSMGFGSVNPSTGLGLGQSQTTTSSGLFSGGTFSFGTPTTTPAPTLNLSFGASTTSAAPTFNLGAPASTPSTGLSFGLGTAAQPSGISFGLGGTTTALSFSKPPTITTTTTQTSFGLGGVVQSTPKSGTSTMGKSEIAPRDQPLPNELLQTVENFKNVVKNEKNYSSDVARYSQKEFKKVELNIDQMASTLNDLEKQLQHSKVLVDKLKLDTANGLKHIEMAQKTMDTPPGLQYDNVMPMVYFKELVDGFEREIQSLKIQIENTHKYIKNFDQPIPLNSQDLAIGMKRLHDTFVALAGRLQTVHAQVENQKEQYLNFRKYMLNDETNVFDIPQKPNEVFNIALKSITYKPPAIPSGPSPFTSLNHPNVVQAAAQNQMQATIANGSITTQQTLGQQTTTASIFSNTPSLNTTFGQPTLQFNSPSNTGFQLQKPPSGNKRGKQITY